MNTSEQQDEARSGGKPSKKPYTAPVLSEYGGMTGLTQGAVATITPVTLTLLDPG